MKATLLRMTIVPFIATGFIRRCTILGAESWHRQYHEKP